MRGAFDRTRFMLYGAVIALTFVAVFLAMLLGTLLIEPDVLLAYACRRADGLMIEERPYAIEHCIRPNTPAGQRFCNGIFRWGTTGIADPSADRILSWCRRYAKPPKRVASIFYPY
ncbi:hypothetical protein C4552_04105 [Candidatus Parcubacteria bacterium]|nr:MAG: hypothetical protein C4552_04105 [Candidatus Parcubacteria bacterium]